jgi:hypothetical protein
MKLGNRCASSGPMDGESPLVLLAKKESKRAKKESKRAKKESDDDVQLIDLHGHSESRENVKRAKKESDDDVKLIDLTCHSESHEKRESSSASQGHIVMSSFVSLPGNIVLPGKLVQVPLKAIVTSDCNLAD